MEFSRQEHWSELPCPPLGDLPDPGMEPWSPALQADCHHRSHQQSPISVQTPIRIICQAQSNVKYPFWGDNTVNKENLDTGPLPQRAAQGAAAIAAFPQGKA